MQIAWQSVSEMLVVIPMSGTGSRFVSAGYKDIKPLIKVFGKPIIKWIVEKFDVDDDFLFICREEHLADTSMQLEPYLLSLAKKVKVVSVENHKLGPVHALLKAAPHFRGRDDIIVNYCDFDWRWNYDEFKSWIIRERPSSAVCVYRGFQPHYISPTTYAYCKCDQNRLVEIQEKQSYTKYREEEPAASGTFYFDNDETLVASCIELIEAGETVNGEYYVSLLFNSEICQKNRCLVYFIDHFMQWGTPEDLEDYIFAARKVPLRFQTQLTNCLNVILMAGRGERMKVIAQTKKPYLNIAGKPLYELCTQNLTSEIKTIFAVNGDEEDYKNLSDVERDQSVEVSATKSSVSTLSLALPTEKKLKKEPILISPSDASIDVNWEDFTNFTNTLGPDSAVVFSYSGYPTAKWKPEEYGWLEVAENNVVTDIGLKTGWNSQFSNPIVTGYFWFSSLELLANELGEYISVMYSKENEPSIDGLCKWIIANGTKTRLFHYQVNDFLCLGTPYEFRSYEYWNEANKIAPIS